MKRSTKITVTFICPETGKWTCRNFESMDDVAKFKKELRDMPHSRAALEALAAEHRRRHDDMPDFERDTSVNGVE